jgi:anti-sigma factor RsiW
MMNDPVYNHLRELSWRRKLTPSEESQLRAWLATHPEAQADWEAEARLGEALGSLPDAPVASNFTARVLQAAKLDEAAERRRGRRPRLVWWRRLAARGAVGAIVLTAGFFSYRHFHAAHVRSEVAEGLVAVSTAEPMPAPDVIEDFDVIRIMPQLYVDEDLLALLK